MSEDQARLNTLETLRQGFLLLDDAFMAVDVRCKLQDHEQRAARAACRVFDQAYGELKALLEQLPSYL